ncbi:MAG: site-2 protease family protein [Firmicutes bacterium]|nr:site-2 protease family protein [Alicyclobacillaceae bacterium]MCL6496713.1 site-2 protease family protein [Bacillota bacterium]
MILGASWQEVLLAIPAVLVAISFHEYAHGWMANRLGDPSPARAGRLSPEPWAHIDWIGLLALLIFGFGWAKPMPVDVRYFRHPRRDLMLTGAAGPLANFVVAWIAALVVAGLSHVPGFLAGGGIGPWVLRVVGDMVLLNVAFGLFNLIPIPPLDGSRVVSGALPPRWADRYNRLEPYGIWILLGLLLFTPVLQWIMVPVRQTVVNWLVSLT